MLPSARPCLGTLPLLLRCGEEVRESNPASSLQSPEKFVVIHWMGFSLLRSVKVHPLASPGDTMLLPLLRSKSFQMSLEVQVRKAMLVLMWKI